MAAGEVTGVLLMHLPGVRILVEHVHALHWEAHAWDMWSVPPTSLGSARVRGGLAGAPDGIRGGLVRGRRITHTLGDFELNEEEDTEGEEDVDAEPAAGRIQAKDEPTEESRPASSSGSVMTKHQAPVPPLRIAQGSVRPPLRALGRDLAPQVPAHGTGAGPRGGNWRVPRQAPLIVAEGHRRLSRQQLALTSGLS